MPYPHLCKQMGFSNKNNIWMILNVVKNILLQKNRWDRLHLGLESSPNFCRKKTCNSKKKRSAQPDNSASATDTCNFITVKAGSENGCYQSLQHLVTPARWHRTQLFPASPGTGSQQRCERECVWAPCARLVVNRRREEIGRRTTEMGERKGDRKKGQHPCLSHQRAVKTSLKSVVASGSAATLSSSKHIQDHDWLPWTPSGCWVGITGSWHPRRL